MPAAGRRSEHRVAGGHRVAGKDKPVARIDRERCDGAPGCPVSRICPQRAVVPVPGVQQAEAQPETPKSWLRGLLAPPTSTTWTVDQERCTGCLLCAQYCPHAAVVPGERRKSA